MNPFLFYLLAERLATDPASGPAEFRTAISRAYYAAYHSARDFLTGLGINPPAGSVGHGKVPIALQNLTDPAIRQAGNTLDTLKGERNRADYALSDPVYNQRATAQAIVSQVFRILGALTGCLGDAARRAQAEIEIKSWVQSKTGALLGFSVA